MINWTVAQQAALATSLVALRQFIWVEARDPDTGLPDPVGFWSDVGDVSVSGRTYYGSGPVIQVSDVEGQGNLTVPTLDLVLSSIETRVVSMIRGSVVAQAPVEYLLGVLDPVSHELLPPLVLRFRGRLDDVDFLTPQSGGLGQIKIRCVSVSRDLTRSLTATRSGPSQEERDPADAFYDYTGVQRRPLYFGRSGVPASGGPMGGGA
jgi:hypothetical protein